MPDSAGGFAVPVGAMLSLTAVLRGAGSSRRPQA